MFIHRWQMWLWCKQWVHCPERCLFDICIYKNIYFYLLIFVECQTKITHGASQIYCISAVPFFLLCWNVWSDKFNRLTILLDVLAAMYTAASSVNLTSLSCGMSASKRAYNIDEMHVLCASPAGILMDCEILTTLINVDLKLSISYERIYQSG